MDLSHQFVGRHLVRNPDHERGLPRVGKHCQVAEHDDIGIGHYAAEHIDEAFSLLDLVAANLERAAIGIGGDSVIGNQQDPSGAGGGVHCTVIIYLPARGGLGRSAQAARPFGRR